MLFLMKIQRLKLIVLPLPEAIGFTWNLLAFLGLSWWQHMIVRGLHKRFTAVEVTGCIRSVFIPRVCLCRSDSAFPFNLPSRRFSMKTALATTVNKAQGQTLKRVGVYLPLPVFPPWQVLYGIFPPKLFISQRRCYNCWRVSTGYRKWWIDNITRCVFCSAFEFQIRK